jgi:hypothetical protein
VKDQYFGDARDYFKYQLLGELMQRVPGLARLTCFWMLTPPDATAEGNVRFSEDEELPELTAFLRRHLESGDKRVRHMREFFRIQGVTYVPWGDEPPYFTAGGRKEYFDGIPVAHLQKALVFFDPDIGLTMGKPTTKHLAIQELEATYHRMDSQSVAVVYQHRARRKDFWNSTGLRIEEALKAPVRWIADSAVAFFILAKDSRLMPAIDSVLRDVAGSGRRRTLGPEDFAAELKS